MSGTRRTFVQSLIGFVGLAASDRGGGAISAQHRVRAATGSSEQPTRESTSQLAGNRESLVLQTRQECALQQSRRPVPRQVHNGDEGVFPSWAANFTKGLPHAQSGEVAPGCYETLLTALQGGRSDAFQSVARGSGMRLVSPQAAFGLNLEGGDAETFFLPPPPSIAGAEGAAEMAEMYWLALARDVPFADYASASLIADACAELGRLSAFSGPGRDGTLSSSAAFRGGGVNSLQGPYLSQFLWKPVPVGSTMQAQKYRSPMAGNDFMESPAEWLQIQAGVPPWREYRWEAQPRHIITGRDLAEYIHYDFMYQAFLNAALILMNAGPGSIYNTNYYFSETNPYKRSKTVIGFVTLGFAQVVDWLARVTTPALKAAWYQKWLVHRYLRPEEFGGLVHRTKTGVANYPLHAEILESRALVETQKRFGSFLLPQAYPEGCPLHPAYPSGHATVAGACVTILKALFDENLAVPDCVEPTADGQSLRPYTGPTLSVRGELEKLAFNVAFGRCFAGIHWRCDGVAGIQLGEEVAITILEDLVNTFAEDFPGFRFTRFNGEPVAITKMA